MLLWMWREQFHLLGYSLFRGGNPSRLTELYSVTGALSLCNLQKMLIAATAGNNGCTIPSISLADNENTVLALRGVFVGKAGNIVAVVLLGIAVTLRETVADRTLSRIMR